MHLFINENTGRNYRVDISQDYSIEWNELVVMATLLLTLLTVTCPQRSFRLSQSRDSLVLKVRCPQWGDELYLSCFSWTYLATDPEPCDDDQNLLFASISVPPPFQPQASYLERGLHLRLESSNSFCCSLLHLLCILSALLVLIVVCSYSNSDTLSTVSRCDCATTQNIFLNSNEAQTFWSVEPDKDQTRVEW